MLGFFAKRPRGAAPAAHHGMLCVPSQKGGFNDRLQPQKYTVSVRSAVKTNGLLSVAAWAPSQKGCRSERPQEHQK
jgi:hypothetical protein